MAKKEVTLPDLEQDVFTDEDEVSRLTAVNNESRSSVNTRITQPESSSDHIEQESQWAEPQNDCRRETSIRHSSVADSYIGEGFFGPTHIYYYNERNPQNCGKLLEVEGKTLERHLRLDGASPADTAKPLPKEDLGWTPVSDKIKFDRRQPLSKHTDVYYGEQDLGIYQRKLAVKLLRKTENDLNEAKILARLSEHPNIVTIIDSGDCEGQTVPHIYIAMELCQQNLDQYIRENPFDLSKAKVFFHQTVKAIAYMHSLRIAHRDLKPTNILVDHETVKISDFGISKQIPDGQSKVVATVAGTEGFKAPECYMCVKVFECGRASDIYPLAINGYYIFTHGKHPFGLYSFDWVSNIARDRNRNLTLVPPFPEPQTHKRSQLIQLLKHMLEYDPKKRPNAAKVDEDEFFNEQSLGFFPEDNKVKTKDIMSIVETIWQSCQDTLQKSKVEALGASLIEAVEKLQGGQQDEGVSFVRRSIPTSWSAEDMNRIGKKLEEHHPVSAIIMHRIAGLTYKPQDVLPEDAVDWISDLAADIRCTAEQILESETGESRDIAIKVCPKFLEDLLHDLRSVKHARGNHRAKCEASCIISISRITINAANYPDVCPNPNMIKICQEGIVRYEDQFGTNAQTKEYYGYMLNNIGEVNMQLGKLDKAKEYFTRSLAVKKEATYRRRDAKLRTIGVSEKNLQQCNLKLSNKDISMKNGA